MNQQDVAVTHPKSRRRRRVIGLSITFIIMLVAVPLFLRERQLWLVSDIGDPFNIQEHGHYEVNPEQNAKPLYDQVSESLKLSGKPDDDDVDAVLNGSWLDASEDLKSWIEDHDDIFTLWVQATEMPYAMSAQPKDRTLEMLTPEISPVINLEELSKVLAKREEELGDWDSAWKWHFAVFRQSRHLAMFGGLISRRMAVNFHSMASERIIRWAKEDSLSAEQLQIALDNVRDAYSLTPSRSEIIRSEYFSNLDILNFLDKHRNAYHQVSNDLGGIVLDFTGKSLPKYPAKTQCFLVNDPEYTRRLLKHQTINLLVHIDRPFREWPNPIESETFYFNVISHTGDYLDPTEFQSAIERTTLDHFILFDIKDFGEFLKREVAKQRMLEVIIASEWYRRINGTYPDSLEDIVERGMLNEIPVDSFAEDGAALLYIRNPENLQRAIVWSVYHNGVNDGGAIERIDRAYPLDLGYFLGD